MTKKEKKQVKQNDNPNVEVKRLEQELEKAYTKIDELTDSCKRIMADLQNYKRRNEEEQKKLVNYANVHLILEILPVLDNLERAMQHKPIDFSGDWLDGISQIYNQFKKILEKQGLEEVQAEGAVYDPNLHEAMLHSDGENGIIVKELEKGYILKGKVIRPSKVVVGNGILSK